MADYSEHFYELLKAFSDDRYVKVDGMPVFLIYRPMEIPDPIRATDFWRELSFKAGLKGLYLVGISHHDSFNPENFGFDARISQRLPALNGRVSSHYKILKLHDFFMKDKMPTVYSYKEVINFIVRKKKHSKEDYPCIIPNWDNTPRSGVNGLVLHESTPELFRKQVRIALNRVLVEPEERRLVFVKAWNEWAEGNHLEPDLRFGKGYLEVLKKEMVATDMQTNRSSEEIRSGT